MLKQNEKDHRKYDDRKRRRNEHRPESHRRQNSDNRERHSEYPDPYHTSKPAERPQAPTKEFKSFEEGFEPAVSKDTEGALRRKLIESANYNDVRIQKSDHRSSKEKKRDKKSRRIDDDNSPTQKSQKKLTKREEKLQMEQIKENMMAKRFKGYVPRDVFAEDEERRQKEQQLKKEARERQEEKQLEQAKQNIIARNKKRCVEDSEESDEHLNTTHKDIPQSRKDDNVEAKSKHDKQNITPIESHHQPKVNFQELFGEESEENIDLIEKKDDEDEKDVQYRIEQKIKQNRIKEEKFVPNFSDPKFLEAINKYKSKN